jgi:hypothetical protein
MPVPLRGSYAGIEAGYGLKLRALLGNILLLHKKCLHLNLFLSNTFTCALNYWLHVSYKNSAVIKMYSWFTLIKIFIKRKLIVSIIECEFYRKKDLSHTEKCT